MTTHRLARSLYYLFVKTLTLVFRNKLFNNKIIRRLKFDTSAPGTLLISNQQRETLVVAASDKVVGKLVYMHDEPFDFDKLERVAALLGDSHKKTVLIDIGANIGTICIPAIKRGLFKRAIAIEPEPGNYSLLMANIFINRVSDRITAHNMALGQRDNESLIFELSDFNHGDHRIRTNNNATLQSENTRNTIAVKSETFNKIITDITPDETLIWIDTQGYEGFILSGASNALKGRTPVCLEFWPYGMARSGCYAALKESLITNGYTRFFNLDEQVCQPVSLTSGALDDLYDQLDNRKNAACTDLLMI